MIVVSHNKNIYELNKNNEIKIKTSVGTTRGFKSGENVTQGSVGGGLISSINLDIPIRHFSMIVNMKCPMAVLA